MAQQVKTKKAVQTKPRPKKRKSPNGSAAPSNKKPLTKAQAKDRAKLKKVKEKTKIQQRKLKEKEARLKKKQKAQIVKRRGRRGKAKQSAFDEQQGDTMSEARLDRLASTPSIWEKMAERDLYDMLRTMGNSPKSIELFQRNRFVQAIVVGTVIFAIGAFMKQAMIMGVGIALGFLIYKMKYNGIKKMNSQWRFERELAFSRFVRLLIPYLKQSEGSISLYTVFNKMLERMDDEEDKNSLFMLMGEMSNRPGDMRPFYDFAERSSGSDMGYLIMSTVYDFQQSTQDTSVIDELGQMASQHMMDAIDEIINFKIKRFGMFPTKIVMSSFILVIGFAAGVLLENIMRMMGEFSGAGLF